MSTPLTDEEFAVRAHDVTTCLEGTAASEFDNLPLVGNAITLSLHLRDCPPLPYQLVKDVAVHALHIHPRELDPVLRLLREADILALLESGKTISTVVPDVPVFENLYAKVGEVGRPRGMNEHEQLTVQIMRELSDSPVKGDNFYKLGADRKVVRRVLELGVEGQFILEKRARGQSVYLSPSYFSKSSDAYANLVAMPGGSAQLRKVLTLLKKWQGWPLKLIQKQQELGGVTLTADEIAILETLAGGGFAPPPAINTTYQGLNHFIFGPRPGKGRLPLNQREIYESALALVAAVRQGQLLYHEYNIRNPTRLLEVLRDRGWIRANTEAPQQYKELAARRVCKLTPTEPGWARLELITGDAKGAADNLAAVNMAIELVRGSEVSASADEDIVLAFQQGQNYVETLIARKRLAPFAVAKAPDDVLQQIDDFLLRGK